MADIRKIIFKPVITERSAILKEADNKFVFEVDPRANKREIKNAVEKLFGVTVLQVRTTILRGKPKTTFEWDDEAVKLLGVVSDASVAKQLGLNPNTVALKRQELGISAFLPMQQWTAEEKMLLGKHTDKEVAQMTGRTAHAVLRARHRFGLPASRKWRRAE